MLRNGSTWRRRRVGGVIALTAAAGVGVALAPNAFALGDAEWTSTEVPNPEGNASVYDVAAPAADDAWAVGGTYTPDKARTTIAHWDGQKWSESKHPEGGYFQAVDATSPEDVWAVGTDTEGDFGWGYAVHFDGKGWKEAEGPEPTTDTSYLWDVDVADDGAVWAAGDMINAPDKAQELRRVDPEAGKVKAGGWEHFGYVQHWNGSKWTVSKPPVPEGASSVQVRRVHAISADEVWASGYFLDPDGDVAWARPWVARYSGGEWTVVDIPDVDDTTVGQITAITKTTDGTIRMAGHIFEGETATPMVLTVDGGALTREGFPGSDFAVETAGASADGGLLLLGLKGTDDTTPAAMRYRNGELTEETTPATDGPAMLTGTDTVPDTGREWVVGQTVSPGGEPTGPVAAYTG